MIPFLDLVAQYRAHKVAIDEAISGVLDAGQFILGPEVAQLEREVAAYCGCAFGVGVASGTDALRLALAALDIGPGDEVITTAFTFIATGNTVTRCGATPVFVDIDPDTFNLSPAAVAAAITPKTKAIVPVHLYGHPAEMKPLLELADAHGLHVVEDCAQALGARYGGARVAGLGHVGCLSFFPTKNLGAYGDAGMVVTNDPALSERIDLLRRQGSPRKYSAEVVGFNSRLDAIQAAILRAKLPHLDAWNEARRQVAARYDALLEGLPVVRPRVREGSEHVFHQYTIRAPRRQELMGFLSGRSIPSMVYYPVPLHRQRIYEATEAGGRHLPESERASEEVLSLPIYPEIPPDHVERTAAAIRKFYRS